MFFRSAAAVGVLWRQQSTAAEVALCLNQMVLFTYFLLHWKINIIYFYLDFSTFCYVANQYQGARLRMQDTLRNLLAKFPDLTSLVFFLDFNSLL